MATGERLCDIAIKEVPSSMLSETSDYVEASSGWSWDRFSQYLPTSLLVLLCSLPMLLPHMEDDTFIWKTSSSGSFTIKAAYSFLARFQEHHNADPWKRIWK